MEIIDIEKFFLNTLLRVCILGLILVIVADVALYPSDVISIYVASVLLAASVIAFLTKDKSPTFSVLMITSIALMAMSYQRLTNPGTSTSLSVVMIVGFVFSVMLKGRTLWVMHGIAFLIVNTVFVFYLPDPITAAITYSTLYFILAFATGMLKSNYDKINESLRSKNIELYDKANEIAAQNEELVQIQENLNAINRDLERMVNERTAKIQMQNQILIKYSYTNAHHLRGPVARLLGLAAVYKLDDKPDANYLITKMVDQAHEIDSVIKRINVELDADSLRAPNQTD